jgi:hypothetical protein
VATGVAVVSGSVVEAILFQTGAFERYQGFCRGIDYRSHGAEAIERAVSQALTAGVSSRDAVEHLLLRSDVQSEMVFPALDNWQVFDPADVSIYDRIGGGI